MDQNDRVAAERKILWNILGVAINSLINLDRGEAIGEHAKGFLEDIKDAFGDRYSNTPIHVKDYFRLEVVDLMVKAIESKDQSLRDHYFNLARWIIDGLKLNTRRFSEKQFGGAGFQRGHFRRFAGLRGATNAGLKGTILPFG